ncbi:MAG: class I SAM-dependent methyltransferase, partial [Gemmatimonadales bacterium]
MQEKRAHRARVRVGRVQHHGLAAAQLEHRCAHERDRGAGLDGVERAVGVDPTWNQISVAAGRGGAVYVRSAAEQLPFPDEAFDAVVACLVFEHIDGLDEAIGEVARVLSVGGRFCFFLNHPLLQTP